MTNKILFVTSTMNFVMEMMIMSHLSSNININNYISTIKCTLSQPSEMNHNYVASLVCCNFPKRWIVNGKKFK